MLDGESLVLLGRKKDMIIRGSHNIYPELIEGTIAGIPGVRRCAIVGLYDPAHGSLATKARGCARSISPLFRSWWRERR